MFADKLLVAINLVHPKIKRIVIQTNERQNQDFQDLVVVKSLVAINPVHPKIKRIMIQTIK